MTYPYVCVAGDQGIVWMGYYMGATKRLLYRCNPSFSLTN